MITNDKFEAWLATPEMRKAEAAFRAANAFWAARREEGYWNSVAFVAQAKRREHEQLKERMAKDKCTHVFEYLRQLEGSCGVVGRCTKCKCRFTAWPGGVHYAEIVAAKKEGE